MFIKQSTISSFSGWADDSIFFVDDGTHTQQTYLEALTSLLVNGLGCLGVPLATE